MSFGGDDKPYFATSANILDERAIAAYLTAHFGRD
jgi:hypothetical protein